MTADCYCDDDMPSFYRATVSKARKPHQCGECGRKIKPGERYEAVAAIWDGNFGTAKTCSHCLDIRTFVKNSVPCFCWAHGSVLDDARVTIESAYWRAESEVKGLAFAVGRLVVARNRARQDANHDR
jgi:hypothetical protein